MLTEIEQLPDDIDSLKGIIKDYQIHVKILEKDIRLLNDKLFGRKSKKWKWSEEEKFQARLFDESELEVREEQSRPIVLSSNNWLDKKV